MEDEMKSMKTNGVWDLDTISKGAKTVVKALVWFWLIDETLSANLVYQVIMR